MTTISTTGREREVLDMNVLFIVCPCVNTATEISFSILPPVFPSLPLIQELYHCKTYCADCALPSNPKLFLSKHMLFKAGTAPATSNILLPRLVALLSWPPEISIHPLLVVQAATTESVLQSDCKHQSSIITCSHCHWY